MKASFSGHGKHPTHLKTVKNQECMQQETISVADHIPDNYAHTRDVLMGSPLQNQKSDSNMQLASAAKQQMYDQFDGQFEIEPTEEELHEENRNMFDQRFEEYGLWEGAETLPDDTQENLDQLWDELEQDEMLLELLDSTGKQLQMLL